MQNGTKRILGVILARGGSKGVPRKNIRDLAGKPLISYSIEEGLKSKYIFRLVVSTEDVEIAQVARNYGADVPFVRPQELASDTATSKVCIQHAVSFCEDQEGMKYDYIVELMCTNPLKTVEDIDAVLEKLLRTNADSVIGVKRLEDHHPARIKKIENDKIVDFCIPEPNGARRQDLAPAAYIRNGSIYAMRRDVLMLQDRRYGTENSRPYFFPPERSVNIDTIEDLIIAEHRLANRNNDVSESIKKNNNMKIVCITPIKHLPSLYEKLCSFGHVIYEPYISKGDLGNLLKKDLSINCLFTNPNKMEYKLDREVLEGTSIKCINTASTGMNHLDLPVIKELGIEVLSLTEDFELIKQLPSTSELAFGLMLSLLRHIPVSFDSVKQGEWDYEQFLGRQVHGLTAGIIGYGRLGHMMARFCQAFGMNVVVYDPYKVVYNYEQVQSLKELSSISDVISLHIHVTDETKEMINKEFFQHMKSDAYLVNTSRGDVVDEHALVEALRQKQFSGYGTDVVTHEFGDLSESPVLDGVKKGLNIIVTPHTGGMTAEGQLLAFGHAIDKFKSIN